MSDFNAWYQQQQETPGGDGDLESQSLFSSIQTNIQSNLRNIEIPTLQSSSPPVLFGLNYATRFRLFIGCLLLSSLFFALGFIVGLPALALRPQKFALCFTFGSITFMTSFAMLKGPVAHVKSMFQADRIVFTSVYLLSMLLTLFCTFSRGGVAGYFLVLGSCSIQLLALLWYLITFLPGGSAGMMMVTSALKQMLAPIARMIVGCGSMCLKSIIK
ncbi:hypothetical protein TrVE_jg11170 [Triparma verrucosa]|uniref:Vesicle transport protein n=2 Tax=Triparma TaxID=722752 RepID=A0A9W6ZW13_9STRA|nr:hypothetical protein TrST_g10581 [Triparma strigata]GMH84082.1 hypothetical protein TrVE_jg11170 [Triparma verrucosa]